MRHEEGHEPQQIDSIHPSIPFFPSILFFFSSLQSTLQSTLQPPPPGVPSWLFPCARAAHTPHISQNYLLFSVVAVVKKIITILDFNPNQVTSALFHHQRPLGVEIMTLSWCSLSGLSLLLSQGGSSWHCSTPFFSTVRLLLPPPSPSLLCYCCLPTTWRS